jgi:hypothetical protein
MKLAVDGNAKETMVRPHCRISLWLRYAALSVVVVLFGSIGGLGRGGLGKIPAAGIRLSDVAEWILYRYSEQFRYGKLLLSRPTQGQS